MVAHNQSVRIGRELNAFSPLSSYLFAEDQLLAHVDAEGAIHHAHSYGVPLRTKRDCSSLGSLRQVFSLRMRRQFLTFLVLVEVKIIVHLRSRQKRAVRARFSRAELSQRSVLTARDNLSFFLVSIVIDVEAPGFV